MKMKRLIVINILLLFLLSILPKEVETQTIETVPETVETISSRSLQEPREEMSVESEKMSLESVKIENKATKISQDGINLVKQFEGLNLSSYKLEGESYYTIGYRTFWN